MSLTIVIPSLGRKTLTRAVLSVDNQTIPTDIIVQFDEREEGAGLTRNRAMQKVTTTWVGFCDDDDYLDERYHEWLARFDDCDMVIFQMLRPDGLVLPDHTDVNRLAYNWVGISFAMRTTIAKQLPFYNMLAEDYNLIMRVKDAGYRIKISRKIGYFIGS